VNRAARTVPRKNAAEFGSGSGDLQAHRFSTSPTSCSPTRRWLEDEAVHGHELTSSNRRAMRFKKRTNILEQSGGLTAAP
jgi:hypothetical protein